MSNVNTKPVILITAFGTSAPEGQKDLENVDRLVVERYPDHEVRWAFTSRFIRKKLIEAGQTTLFARKVPNKNLEEVYADLRNEGKRDVAVQCLLITPGSEYSDALKVDTSGLNVEYGYPLLAPPDNVERIADTLAPRFGGEDTVTIICGHGNEKMPVLNIAYIQMDNYLRKRYQRVFLTTLEGPPGTGPAFEAAKKLGLPKAVFIPLLIVAGGHLVRDIMGTSPESYLSKLGLVASSETGLGSDPAVMSIWMESIDWVLTKFSR
ncbi:MAG: sirohydrochlorin cobaltochelatase [Dehalococcoidales bacterium]|jgi:sirohydrochlorin cobaltochelatase